MRAGLVLLAISLLAFSVTRVQAFDIAFSGYADARLIAPTGQTGWVQGGLGKFRFGSGDGNFRFVEAVGQADVGLDDLAKGFSATFVGRLEPTDSSGLDFLEAYTRYAPVSDGPVSFSVKTGAFFPSISLENDDMGWASPYTLTPSAINSWIGEELRTIGSEATLRWDTKGLGTLSAIGAIICCNDEAGIVMADRGWAMDDRPSGLFERIRLPDATARLFHIPTPNRTGLFDEIDGNTGWYGGADWQLADIGKISVLRYDNGGDPAARTTRDTAWETKFWSFGARTQIAGITLMAQQLSGYTSVVAGGAEIATKFQSGFLLASYDLEDWRFSAREDLFQTRHLGATPSLFSEDGNAFTAAVSWTGIQNLRLTGEVVAMNSRRPEYALDGLSAQLSGTQSQFSVRYFF
jgi:hypothetical protein